MRGGRHKVRMRLLLQHLSREIPILDIYVPVLIPALGLIPRDIVSKDVNEHSVYRFAICQRSIGVGHSAWMACSMGRFAPFWHCSLILEIEHILS